MNVTSSGSSERCIISVIGLGSKAHVQKLFRTLGEYRIESHSLFCVLKKLFLLLSH